MDWVACDPFGRGEPVKERRRIAFLIPVSEAGGAEQSLLQTIALLPRDRYDLWAVLPSGGSLSERLKALGTSVVPYPLRRFQRTGHPFRLARDFWAIHRAARDLAAWCRETGIALLHANGDQALLVAGPTARRAGIPCVRHARDWTAPDLLGRWLARQADHTIAVSQAVADRIIQAAPRGPVSVVYNGFDVESWRQAAGQGSFRQAQGIPSGALVIGMVAQPVAWKRADLFIEAAQRIGRERSDAHFVMALGDRFGGGEAYLRALTQQIQTTGMTDRFHRLGWREDIASVMNAFDILLHPADGEPFGRVVVEAMALEKAVVAVRQGGPAETIREGQEGLLVPPGDPVAMAEAVLTLARDPALRRQMGQAARRRVEKAFSLSQHRDGIEAVYDRLLGPPRGVAIVVGGFPGLSETFIRRGMTALISEGTDVHVFAMAQGQGKLSQREQRALGGRVVPSSGRLFIGIGALRALAATIQHPQGHRIVQELLRGDPEFGSRLRMMARLGMAWLWTAEARRRRIGHVHAHFLSATADVGRWMALLMKTPFTLSAHGRDLFASSPPTIRRRVEPAAWIAVCSRAGQDRLRALLPRDLPSDRIRLIPHGLGLEEFPKEWDRRRPPRIAAAGRFVEKKGFAYLIEACQRLASRGTDFTGTLIGDGPLRADLERRVRTAGLNDRLRLPGAVDDPSRVMDLFSQARLVAIPSIVASDGDQDGIPNVALEAMAAGTPIVAFATGGIPEVVVDRRTGFLVPPGRVDLLAEAMDVLLKDEAMAHAMGHEGRAEAERRFDVQWEAQALKKGFDERGVGA